MKSIYVRSVLLIIGLVLLQSFQNKTDNFVINASITGNTKDRIAYLCTGENVLKLIPVDSTVINDGKIQFKGKIDYSQLMFIKLSSESGKLMERNNPVIPLLIDNGEINIEAPVEGLLSDMMYFLGAYNFLKVKISGSGSESQKKYMEYLTRKSELSELRRQSRAESYRKMHVIKNPSIKDGIDAITKEDSIISVTNAFVNESIGKNIDNTAGALILKDGAEVLTLEEINKFEKKILNKNKNNPFIVNCLEKTDSVKLSVIGAKYTDLTFQNPKGENVKLSDYIGKGNYVMLEFWASWCGPCRGEIPHLKRIYEKYHPKGFEIISISIDTDKDAWHKALEEEQMKWIQISDLKRVNMNLGKIYNYIGVPHCLLINPEGIIESRFARGAFLDKFLISIYGE